MQTACWLIKRGREKESKYCLGDGGGMQGERGKFGPAVQPRLHHVA
jgi:hypothetical protein